MDAQDVLARCSVPGHAGWYFVGCRETARVTIYAQQVRALNLAWALKACGLVRKGTRAVVVGAGAAGLTFAAGLARFDAKVTVLEKEDDPLPLQRNCYKRHLHPHIYDWPLPGWVNANAGLPLLNWRAGMAREVAATIEGGFEDFRQSRPGSVELVTGAENIELDVPLAGQIVYRKRPAAPITPSSRLTLGYDLLVFAVGFGVEHSLWMGARGSYWADDSLDQEGVFPAGRYLVSGSGDGGLIDVLRIALRNFRQENLARIVQVDARAFPRIREEILSIDDAARASGDAEGRVLFQRYQALRGETIDDLDRHIASVHLNTKARVTLLCRSSSPFSLRASSLHRLLFSRLLFRFPEVLDLRCNVALSKSMLQHNEDGRAILSLGSKTPFDHVIVRHGPVAAINAFPQLQVVRALPDGVERTADPLYGDSFGSTGAIAWGGAPTRDDYLEALEDAVAMVPSLTSPASRVPCPSDVDVEVLVRDVREEPDVIAEEDTEGPDRPAYVRDNERRARERERFSLATEHPRRLGQKRLVFPYPGHAVLPITQRPSGVTLLHGKAGTGKSTYLRLLALAGMQAKRTDMGASSQFPLPVYVARQPELDPEGDTDVPEAMADAALRTMEVASYSAAATAIRRALRSGHALVLMDAVDDWDPDDLAQIVDWLSRSGVPALVAARRVPSALRGLGPIPRVQELLGIVPTAAKRLLRAYFAVDSVPDAAVEAWLERLRNLPNGDEWVSSPFLLLQAARIFSRGGMTKSLSRTALYEEVLETALQEISEEKRDRIRSVLVRAAQQDLFGERVRLVFPRTRFDWEDRPLVLATHLVTGGNRLEFAHLSVAEHLASTGGIDLTHARKMLRENPDTWQHNLEVLPMAHARDEGALSAALMEVGDDTAEHRGLCLVLRAIAYGGAHVEAFCQVRRDDIVREVAARLSHASGKFGNDERELMRAFERAAPYLKGARIPEGRLPTGGEPGAEAWILRTFLSPDEESAPPPGSIYWATIFCQARLLLGLRPAEVVERTAGGEPHERSAAVRALSAEGVSEAKELLHHRNDHIRQMAMVDLRNQVPLAPRFIGLLGDDEAWVRLRAIQSQGAHFWAKPSAQDALLSIVRDSDETDLVKAAAIADLMPSPSVTPELVQQLRRVLVERRTINGHTQLLLERLIPKLSDTVEAMSLVLDFVRTGKAWFIPSATLRAIMVGSERMEMLRQRLLSDDPLINELEAARGNNELAPTIRTLVRRFAGQPSDWYRLALALRALPKNDDESREVRLACLDASYIPDSQSHVAYARGTLLSAAIGTFAGDPTAVGIVRPFLELTDERDVAAAALECIGAEPTVRPLVWAQLVNGEDQAQAAAVKILGALPEERDRLRRHFETLPGPAAKDRSGFGGDAFLRSWLMAALAPNEPTDWLLRYLDDGHEPVRERVVTELLGRNDAQEPLRQRALLEPSEKVQRLLWEKFKDDAGVKKRIGTFAREDRGDVRHAYFLLLSNIPTRAEELRAYFREVAQDSRVVEVALAAGRDGTLSEELRRLLDSDDERVRSAVLRTMGANEPLRTEARERLRDAKWLGMFSFSSDVLVDYFQGDVEARRIACEQLADGKAVRAVSLLARIARGGPSWVAVLRQYIDHPAFGDEIQALLADEPDVREALVQHLEAKDGGHERRRAAEALWSAGAETQRLAELTSDSDDAVREVAYRAALRLRVPVDVLLRRLEVEPKDELRRELVDGLLRVKDAGLDAALRRRLAVDRSASVRALAVSHFGGDVVRGGLPVRLHARVQQDLGGWEAGEIGAFLRDDRELDGTRDPALFGQVVTWACAKLVSTVSETIVRDTRVDPTAMLFGEFAEECADSWGEIVKIRLAKDASELPRDRDIYPAANVLAAWEVMSRVRAPHPMTILVACATAPFDVLDYPRLTPGDLRFGPTFFGFGMRLAQAPQA